MNRRDFIKNATMAAADMAVVSPVSAMLNDKKRLMKKQLLAFAVLPTLTACHNGNQQKTGTVNYSIHI